MPAASLTDASAGLPSLEGRVAVVTAAGDGSGRACAELLARLGAAVGVLDSDPKRTEAVAAAIEAYGGAAEALVADVAEPDQVAAAAEALEARFGACDVLVNCAVAAPEAPLEELELAAWDRATAVNLGGPFTCMQVFGRGMLARGGGSVVNVAPAATPRPGAATATTAAAGQTMLARLGAVEWGNRGVRVNAVEVAPTARPAAVAAAVAFLAGDGAGYVSGESFEVNEEVRAMPAVEIDHEACEGSRYCEGLAPDLFRVNDDEKAELIVDEVPEDKLALLEEAEALCPTFAIKQRARAGGEGGK